MTLDPVQEDEAGKKEVNVIIFHLTNSSDDSDDILLQPSDQLQARLQSAVYSTAVTAVYCAAVISLFPLELESNYELAANTPWLLLAAGVTCTYLIDSVPAPPPAEQGSIFI